MQNLGKVFVKPSVKWAAFVLGAFYLLALAAPLVSPYVFDAEERRLSYAPPTSIHLFDQGQWKGPFVYGLVDGFDQYHQRTFKEDRTQVYPIKFFHQGKLFTVDTPGRLYLLGADSRGRDMLSRLLYGARISLTVGLIGAVIAFSIGLLVGVVAGYFGGWVDQVLMRTCEVFMLAPAFYLMLALRSAVPANFSSSQVYFMVIVILSLIGWASLARIIRGMSLSLRQRSYIDAAKLLGLSDAKIMIKHILPHTASYALVAVSLTIPSYILAEAGLSLLGLGIQDPIPSWGNMLADSMAIVVIRFAPWIIAPGFLILITIICFNRIGEAFRDALDPLFHKDNASSLSVHEGALQDSHRIKTAASHHARVDLKQEASILVIEDLSVWVKDRSILNEINVSLTKGSILAIVGESGSGKTTLALSLLHMLNPVMRFSAKQYIVNGYSVINPDRQTLLQLRGADVGFVFQEPLAAFDPLFTIGSHLDEALRVHTDLSAKAREQRIIELLARVGLADVAGILSRYPHQISGGQRQRAMMALACICYPKLLIADEPTSNLDHHLQDQIIESFKKLNQELQMSMIIITHDISVVKALANWVMVLKDGQVVEYGQTDKVMKNPQHPYTRRLIEVSV